MPLTNYAKDKYVAPELSRLTECNAPDMASHDDQCTHWVANFILNSMFRVDITQPQRSFFFAFLRRAENAFYEYDSARRSLQAYVEQGDLFQYMRAVYNFETFLSQTWQGYAILKRLSNRKPFQKGEDSPLERLNVLHNKSKHTDSAIESGEVPGDTTMPIWLTNEGIECAEATLTYQEMCEILASLAVRATQLSNPLPVDESTEG